MLMPSSPHFKSRPRFGGPRSAEWLTFERDHGLFEDPLFTFHFRTFARLYHRLWLAKPLLIQGGLHELKIFAVRSDNPSEQVSDDPWKLLIAVTLLNKTAGKLAIPVFWEIVKRWPTPLALSKADEEALVNLIRPLGLSSIRTKRLIQLSNAYLQDPPTPSFLYRSRAYTQSPSYPSRSQSSSCYIEDASISVATSGMMPELPCSRQRYPSTPISHLPGTGKYALDSYCIFCNYSEGDGDGWKNAMPEDKELIRYMRWKWAFAEQKVWIPGVGVTCNVDAAYLDRLVKELNS